MDGAPLNPKTPAAPENRAAVGHMLKKHRMITLLAKAEGTGRVVNWSRFKRGDLVDQSRFSLTPTTVIPDVLVDIMEKCKSMDPLCSVEPLFLNGFTTTQFDISIKGNRFAVNCGRRLARGLFPLNPLAAEFGSNYDVLVTICGADQHIEETLGEVVSGKYQCRRT